MFYDDLLNELNTINKPNCIEFSVRDHHFTCWDSSIEEDICEMDHINHRWELVKEYVSGVVPGHGLNMCNTICRKQMNSYYFHDSCELVNFLRILIENDTQN